MLSLELNGIIEERSKISDKSSKALKNYLRNLIFNYPTYKGIIFAILETGPYQFVQPKATIVEDLSLWYPPYETGDSDIMQMMGYVEDFKDEIIRIIGTGRIVLITKNEIRKSNLQFADEVLRDMLEPANISNTLVALEPYWKSVL